MKAREVRIVSTSAAWQAARMLAAPAVKLIIAGTRPADISANRVTAAPLAFGSITPIGLPSGASGISFSPSTRAPISELAIGQRAGDRVLDGDAAQPWRSAGLDQRLDHACGRSTVVRNTRSDMIS